MRTLARLIAVAAAFAAGLWVASHADEILKRYLGLEAGDQRVWLAQGGVAVTVAWFLGQPLWNIASFLFPRRRPLIPCPDCDHLVSKLATLCPECGRPLEPQRPASPVANR